VPARHWNPELVVIHMVKHQVTTVVCMSGHAVSFRGSILPDLSNLTTHMQGCPRKKHRGENEKCSSVIGQRFTKGP